MLKVVLKKAFGFNHILWVFSGRRGIHAWVCDKEAKFMTKKLRSAITEFLNLTINNEKVDFLVKEDLIKKQEEYFMVTQSYEILKKYKKFLIVE